MNFNSELGLLQAALVVCYFTALLFKPQRIRFGLLFGMAFVALIAAVALTPAVNSMIVMGGRGRFNAPMDDWMLILMWTGPALTGLSMLLVFCSLGRATASKAPAQQAVTPAQPKAAKKHPLDE